MTTNQVVGGSNPSRRANFFMKISYLVKLNFLVLALLLVIFAMSKLRRGISDGVAMVMGLHNGAAAPPSKAAAAVTVLDWCDTRVKSLSRPGKPTLTQARLKWLWQSDPALELNAVAVEKWFGRYCRVQIERVDPAELGESAAALVVDFVKGPSETLQRSVAGVFKWRQEIFKSAELSKALEDLEALPDLGARTSR